MIENIRKYTGLMAVVFILLAAGFLFTMNDGATPQGGMSGPTYLEVHGRSLDQKDYSRMGERTLQLATAAGLNNYVNFLMVDDIREMEQLSRYGINYFTVSQNSLTNQDVNRFITNRIVLQKAMDDMGVYASEEEISETLKTGSRFTKDGSFDSESYKTFIEQGIGNLGMTEQDLREIIGESICLSKIVDIIGGGLIGPKSAVKDLVEAQAQTVTFSRIALSRASFLVKVEPTEEEIKAYWDSHQDAYKTEQKRRISYVLLTIPPMEDANIAPLPENATEEQKAEKKIAIDLAASIRAELKVAAGKKLKTEMQEVSQVIDDAINDKQVFDFAKIISDRGEEIVSTELFSNGQLPEALKPYSSLRGDVNQGKTLSDEIFQINISDSDEYSHISSPLPVGESAWIIFTVDEVVEPTLLDYASAKDAARSDFVSEAADKALKEAADTAHKAMSDALAAGKSFADAAKENELEPVQVGPYSSTSTPPSGEPSYRQLTQTASGINPGELSEVIHEAERSLFIHLDKREIEDTEKLKTDIDAAHEGMQSQLKILTFMNWLKQQYSEAEVSGVTTEAAQSN